jgi:hypothetical protein
MAIEERFAAVISVRNLAGPVLRQIGAQFASLSRQTGLTRIAAAAAGAGRAFAGLAVSVGSVAGPLAAVAATGAALGLGRMATGAASAAGALSDLAARTGVSVQDLQELGDSARLAGVDQATLAAALQKLNRGLADAATGGAGDLGPALRHLGISMRDANGEIRNAADLLPELANAFAQNENQALRVRLATELFGRAGEQLIPMLANGGAALEESRNRFRAYGYSMSEAAERLAQIDDVFETLQVATEGLSQAIGAQLAPILGPIAQSMADWTRANRDLIATNIGSWASGLAETFGRIFADRGPLERLGDFAASVGRVVEALGGAENVLIGFGVLAAAPFVAALVSIVAAFGPLLAALGSLALALGAASPLGLAIIGFGALAAALVADWGGIGSFFARLWQGVVTGMAPQLDMLRQFVEAVGAPLVAGLRAAWSGLTEFFTGLWAGITAVFDAAWSRLQPVVEAISAAMAPLRVGSSPTGPVNSPGAQAQRRANQATGGAQRIEGFDAPDPPPVPSPLGSPLPSVLPNPLAAAALAAPPQQGRVEVEVTMNNLPAGTRVEATSEGNLVQQPRTNVGFALGRPRQ